MQFEADNHWVADYDEIQDIAQQEKIIDECLKTQDE